MKKRQLLFALFFIINMADSFCQQKTVPVFVSGTEGYTTYRIPAIIRLPNGQLLAFCEGRVNNAGDFGNIDIVLKRSNDGGNSWGPLQVVTDNKSLQAGNPAPVVDLLDPQYPAGRIFLFYNTGNNHENEIRKGNGYRQVWYKTSTDGGNTWSDARDITSEVNRLNKPGINPRWNYKEDWRSYANTPGHAIQFTEGKYAGRIFIAANHSAGPPQEHFMDYQAHGFFTDDHGKTFKLGEPVNIPGSNESMAVALSNNKMMMNSRNQSGNIKARIVSVSSDGGASWDTSFFDLNLIDPVNQGSILNVGNTNGKAIIAFCNAADTLQRNNLTLRISFDEGKTWSKHFSIDKGDPAIKKDHTAYSDLVKISKDTIGVLYEKDDYRKTVFTVVKW